MMGSDRDFYRFRVSRELEFIDYFDWGDFRLENRVYEYKKVNDFLYVYGETGYTKVKLSFFTKIEKVINQKHDPNFSESRNYYNHIYHVKTIKAMKEHYGNTLQIVEDFSTFTDEELKIFLELKNKRERWNGPYDSLIGDTYYHVDGTEVFHGLINLNRELDKECEKRFGRVESNQ